MAPADAPPAADADYAQVKALFSEVCDLPDRAAQRTRLQELGASETISRRVLALIGHDATQTTHFAVPVAGMLASAAGTELKPGERLGAWTLRSELGHGGMGMVYLAERSDGHYQQRAAIKLLRGWSGEAALAQLARERQILASLNHPHIARLIDGGTTPGGQPYLVMDYVEGLRIDSYVRQQDLGLEATLDLFVMVCEAVAYAHRQLVVHCDIKPGNVLVGTDGRAMLLDFGIAQLQQGLQDGPAEASLALTPRYASPEQRAGATASSASDIYSLGAMLGELLESLGPRAARPQEWRAIVQRATEHEAERRYLAVAALVADLRRFRQHLPLVALPHGAGYLARKFVRRRWPGVLAGSAALTMSLVFTLRLVQERDRALQAETQARESARQAQVSAESALRAGQTAITERDQATRARALAQHERDAAVAAEARADGERRRAEAARQQSQQEADTTRQVSDFVVSLFEGADPKVSGRPDLSAATLVDKGRERMDGELRGQPALQASMKGVLGKVYENIGRPRDAVELYEQAVNLEQTVQRPLREAAMLNNLAMALSNTSQAARALEPARRSLALRQARLPADALELAESHNTLGWVLSRNYAFDEARQHLDRSLAIRQARLGPEHLDVAITLHNLGMLHQRAGQLALAENDFRRALAIKTRLLDDQHPTVLNTVQTLATVLAEQHRTDEALTLQQRVLMQRRTVHGSQSAAVSSALNELAGMLQDAGRSAEAISTYGEALALTEQLLGRRTLSSAVQINNLATALDDLGDPAAESRYRESLAIRQDLVKPDDLSLARAQHNLGRWLLRAGRLDEARPLLEQAAALRRAKLPAAGNDRIDAELSLAESRLLDGDLPAAEAGVAFVAAQEGRLQPLRRVALWRAQALLARQRGATSQALERQQAALQLASATVGPGHPVLLRLRIELAELAAGLEGGEALRRQDIAAAITTQHAQSPLRARALRLDRLLAQDKP
nr:serine/threonine-protein kinase [uncultured Roseateles sp.]